MFALMTLQAPSGLGAALGSPLVMMVIVMGIFYVMLILPQQRQRKKLQEMLSTLKAGDKVVTNGGIYGVINGIDGDTVILKIAEDRKSTRLNSSHQIISYAVFCLKKKKTKHNSKTLQITQHKDNCNQLEHDT